MRTLYSIMPYSVWNYHAHSCAGETGCVHSSHFAALQPGPLTDDTLVITAAIPKNKNTEACTIRDSRIQHLPCALRNKPIGADLAAQLSSFGVLPTDSTLDVADKVCIAAPLLYFRTIA